MRYALTETISGLLGVDIKEKSVNALLLCPFHGENTPSFSIHLDEGMWKCFGCGESGGIKKLYRKLGEEMSSDIYHDALIRSLSAQEHKRDFSSLANAQAMDIGNKDAISSLNRYIASKPISRDVIRHFGIGWSREKSAISMPYWDDGTVSGIKYRGMDGRKTAETGSSFGMYGVDNIRGKSEVVICEGESDTHAMWSVLRGMDSIGVCGISGGIHNGSAWSLWAIDMMYARKVYIAFDADEVGDNGYLAAYGVLGEEKCVRLRPTHGKDVCDHIMNGGSFDELGLAG
jgi:DNA primase